MSATFVHKYAKPLNHYEWAGENNFFVSLKLEGQRGLRTCDLQLSNAPGPALYMYRVLHVLPI